MTGPSDVREAAGYPARSPALDVHCTHCGAVRNEECHGITPSTRGRRREPHPARVLSAAEPRAVVIPFPAHPPPRSP